MQLMKTSTVAFFACSSLTWTCWRPIYFCSAHLTAEKHPPLPTYGTSEIPTKPGFCAVNDNCLKVEHMAKLSAVDWSSRRLEERNYTILSLFFGLLSFFWTKMTKLQLRTPKSTRTVTQIIHQSRVSICAVSSDWNYSQAAH